MSENMLLKCCNCESEIDENGDYGWSHVKNAYLCIDCRQSDEESVSTVFILDDTSIKKYFIGNHVRINEHGDEIGPLYSIDRTWVNTGGYRGHHETTIDGWSSVLSGWTTGAWGDPTSDRKTTFNEWAENLMSGKIKPPVPIAIVVDPTSNLFSTGISVLTEHADIVNNWLGVFRKDLSYSLS